MKENKLPKEAKINIAIFASGAGSNAQKIIEYFKAFDKINISLIVSNNLQAGVLKIATHENIPVLILEKEQFKNTGYVEELKNSNIAFIVLAGFLWKVPTVLISAFSNKIINIHPALLPSYGGKGMYGDAVHKAVIDAKEKESGITIHYVDDKYDHGEIIFQAKCTVDENDTVDSLSKKIHELEHMNYAKEIEKIISEIF